MVTNKKKWFIVVAITLLAMTINFAGCGLFGDNASSKIEVIEQPSLKYRIVGNRYSPAVQAVVKNKTDSTIKMEMTCTVYASDGSVTTGLKSRYATLVAGETVTLIATTTYTYSAIYYNDLCASFGKVEYKFY